jgi:hypothetical protein
MVEWIEDDTSNQNKRRFLESADLRTNTHPIIAFRAAFKEDKYFDSSDIKSAFGLDESDLDDTLNWIKENFETILLRSNREVNLRKLLDYYWEVHKKLPVEIPFLEIGAYTNRIFVKIDTPDWAKTRYVETLAEEEDEMWCKILESQDLVFIYTPDLHGQGIREGLRKRNISKAWLVKEISSDLNVTGHEAWDDSIYTQWKELDAPEIDIFLLNQSVPFNYYFESENIRALIEQSSGKVADRLKTTIYIFKENPTVNIFQILSEHQEILFPDDSHLLVKLLARKVAAGNTADIFTEAQNVKIQENLQEFQNIIDTFDSNEVRLLSENAAKLLPILKDGNLQNIIIVDDENLRNAISDNLSIIKALADKDAFEVIGKLLERASKEQLEKLLDIWDEVEQELEKERSKPKPVALIGYLGERLVYLWLQNKELDPKNVQHVAKIEPAFDVLFNHNDHPYCVEVKTTIKSALEADNAIPFFLRASQYDFIQKNPDKDYIVFRLSLQDIGLTHLYDKYKVLGSDLNAILENSKDEIDEDLMAYINNENSVRRFKHNRMVFRMNIPKIDMEFWESF